MQATTSDRHAKHLIPRTERPCAQYVIAQDLPEGLELRPRHIARKTIVKRAEQGIGPVLRVAAPLLDSFQHSANEILTTLTDVEADLACLIPQVLGHRRGLLVPAKHNGTSEQLAEGGSGEKNVLVDPIHGRQRRA